MDPRPAGNAGDGASPFLIVFTLWLLVFSSASQIMIISPILPTIGEQLGIGDAALGTLVSAYSIMVGVFAIISGPISDKIGRRRILMVGAATMTLALSLHGLVVGYVSFLAVRVFAGMAGGILSGAAVSSRGSTQYALIGAQNGVMPSTYAFPFWLTIAQTRSGIDEKRRNPTGAP